MLNRGCTAREARWQEAEAKAYFADRPDPGFLKVSFFGPFYGSSIVFAFDLTDYHSAAVSEPTTASLWILAKTLQITPDLNQILITRAAAAGLTCALIFVDQQ